MKVRIEISPQDVLLVVQTWLEQNGITTNRIRGIPDGTILAKGVMAEGTAEEKMGDPGIFGRMLKSTGTEHDYARNHGRLNVCHRCSVPGCGWLAIFDIEGPDENAGSRHYCARHAPDECLLVSKETP